MPPRNNKRPAFWLALELLGAVSAACGNEGVDCNDDPVAECEPETETDSCTVAGPGPRPASLELLAPPELPRWAA